MLALTLKQPWAWAVAAGLKTIENRDWLPNWRRLKAGDDLAIHAGVSHVARDDYFNMRRAAEKMGRGKDVPALSSHEFTDMGRGRVVAVATFVGIVRTAEECTEAEAPWFLGRYGWRFSNVRQLQLGSAPKVLGQLGLWDLPAGLEDQVLRQLAPHNEGQLWRRPA